MRRWLSLTPFDGLLLLMVLIWGANYSVVKTTLREIPPQAFNALRLVIASIVFLIAASIPELRQIVWGRVPLWAWASLALSAVLALNVAYLIWYTSVQRIGNIRTSAYSNIIPLVAMTIAAVALGETLTLVKVLGAAAILSGVAITRMGNRFQSASDPPAEE